MLTIQKSILISCGARLAPFDIKELRDLTAYDELELDTLGEKKTALFVIISDTDATFNFIVSIMYSQLFNLLCDKADAFCKTVIRHAAIDAARSIRSRRKREISLEYLIEEKHYPFSTTDKYFAEQSGMTSYPLFVCGQMVLLESPELAAALSALSQMEQEIIFLYYFQRLTHREIGRRYGRAGNTTGRRIQMILRRLRAELEGLSYEPATFL